MATQEIKPASGSALQNAGWLIADKVVRMAIGLVVGIWVARYLGPEQFGLLSYAAAFVSLFAWLSDLGLERIVVRELVTRRLERGQILGTAFLLKLAGGFVILAAATGIAGVLNPGDVRTIVLVAITAAGTIAQAADVVDYDFQALLQSKYVTVARSIAFQVISVLKLLLIFYRAPLKAFAVAGAGELLLAASMLLIVHRAKAVNTPAWQWSFATARTLLRDSWSLMFASLMVMVYMRIDQVMLKSLSSVQEIGKYAASVRISEGWYFVLVAISTSIFPKLVDANAVSQDRLDSTVRRFYAAMVLVAYVFALPLSLFSGVVSTALYGAEYEGMQTMLAISVWAGVFVGVGLIRSAYCNARNLNTFLLLSTAAGAVLNILLNFTLIPQYGGRGAAVATLAAYAVGGYATSFFYGPTVHQGRIVTQMFMPWNAWKYSNWRDVFASLRRLRGSF
ncbi:MAG TPA: flippase [Terriglobia bacterium]|jgi:O-antigen/teichoic acid export membrane protein